ncbi:MAG: alpha/beta hydrolase [Chloroflexi bacterium]|nr:alpha/beta hydrolase [Chloroflexota bacterium]
MPHITINGANLYYEEEGSGPQTIVFGHSLLLNLRMFDDQVAHLKDRYRCVRFDWRGQGQSEVTEDGYDMDSLYEDAVALIAALDCAPCHWVGFSMGGFVGLRLAIRRPDLLRSLILIDTSAAPEPDRNKWEDRLLLFIARWLGFRLVIGSAMKIFFAKKFLTDPARKAQVAEWRGHLLANDPVGMVRAVKGVITRQGVLEQIDKINLPTLIIVGEEDVATTPDKSRQMHAHITNSTLITIPDAGHVTPVEEPAAVNAALDDFLMSG